MQDKSSDKSSDRVFFEIVGRFEGDKTFPSLNQYINAIGRNPKAGGRYKKQFIDIAVRCIRRSLRGWKTDKPVILHYKFYEPSKGQKRDYGNIFSCADKFIEDALQETGTIPNDDPKHVRNFTHEFYYTDTEPFIRVEIEVLDE